MTDDNMEKQIAEMARIEKLKGVRTPTRAQQYFQPARPTQEQLEADATEADRHERLKRPTVLPPKAERDFIADKRTEMEAAARHERLKAASGARLG
jgi:hypothetical protein